MRYILAIAGLAAAAIVTLGIWMFLPRGDVAPSAVAVSGAQAQGSPPEPDGPIEAESGEGSLRVCNQTANRVSIAFGYRAVKGWQSEGWWVAEPTNCVTVYRGNLEDQRYYYFYAADDVGGGVWDGTNYMCTRDETFTIFGVEDCLARGYERTGFFEVDTGRRSDWTVQLTEGEVLSEDAAAPAAEDAAPLEGELPSTDEIPLEESTDPQ